MSVNERKTWLVAYDIREPKRLRRVHRLLRQHAASVQYSTFSLWGNDRELRDVMQSIEGIIDTKADDVRAYRLPSECKVWALGCQGMPDGVTMSADLLGPMLDEFMSSSNQDDSASPDNAETLG